MRKDSLLTAEQRGALLTRQQADWPRLVNLGSEGNPFATLCDHCCGRHKPPMDEICPNQPPPR